MAKILRLNKRDARIFITNVSNADASKDIKLVMRYRRLARKFASYCQPYWDDAKVALDAINTPAAKPNSEEYLTARAALEAELHNLDSGAGLEPARDEHTDGILLETEEFNFLSTKFGELKGIPSEGAGGQIWENIFDAFEEAEEVKIRPVEAHTQKASGN